MAVESVTNYKDVLIVLGAAGLAVPLLRRLGINTILGFLIVGVVLSPGILGRLAMPLPFLENLKLSQKAPEELSNEALFLNALEKLKDNIMDSATPIRINETAYFTAAEDDAFRYSGDNWTLNDKGFNGFRMKYSDLIRFYEENVTERKEIKELNNISGLAKQHASYFFKAIIVS